MKLGHGLGFAVRRIFTSSSLPNNLIAYWNMSSTAASVGGASMTLNGINNGNFFDSTAPLINSQYLRPFNASYSQRTNSTLSLNWSGNFTLNFWFKMTYNDAVNSGTATLIAMAPGFVTSTASDLQITVNNDGIGNGFLLFGDADAGVLAAFYDGNSNTLTNITDGTWKMITLIHTADGIVTGIVNANRSLNTVNTDSAKATGTINEYIGFGRNFIIPVTAVPAKAGIDETGIWNRVLTDVEITQLYNAGTGKFYPFS